MHSFVTPTNEVCCKLIFSQASVIHSVRGGSLHPGGGVCIQGGGVCIQGGWEDPYGILRDTVNKRVVRILLDCILVLSFNL